MSKERRAVITGIGIVSSLGIGREKYWQNIQAGLSSVRELTLDQSEYLPLKYGSRLGNVDCKEYFSNPKLLKNLNRANQFALLAAQLAITDARGHAGIPPERKGLFFLTGMGQVDELDLEQSVQYSTLDGHFSYDLMGEKGMKLINPLLPVKSLPNIGLGIISILFGFQGMNIVASPFESETAMLVDDAIQTIKNNEADLCLVGGTDAPFCVSIMSNLTTMERHWREKDPSYSAVQDFALPLAEGAVFIVLEEAKQAMAAGKRIYGYIERCFSSSLAKIPWDYDELQQTYDDVVTKQGPGKDAGMVILADNGIEVVARVETDYWRKVGRDPRKMVSFKRNTGFLITSAQLLDIGHACLMMNDTPLAEADLSYSNVESVLICGVSLSQGVSSMLVTKTPESYLG